VTWCKHNNIPICPECEADTEAKLEEAERERDLTTRINEAHKTIAELRTALEQAQQDVKACERLWHDAHKGRYAAESALRRWLPILGECTVGELRKLGLSTMTDDFRAVLAGKSEEKASWTGVPLEVLNELRKEAEGEHTPEERFVGIDFARGEDRPSYVFAGGGGILVLNEREAEEMKLLLKAVQSAAIEEKNGNTE
jgi:hypothetical protein